MKTRTVAALSALVAATALAATAGFAAVSAAPDPAKMVLQAADIPNSKVKGKRLKPENGYVAVYARDFELSKPYGSSQLVFISSEVALAATAKTTVTEIAGIRKFLRSTQGRQFLASTFAAELGTAVTKKDVTIGNLRTPSIGDEAVLVSLTVRTKQGRFYAAFTWFRVDRALSTLVGFRSPPRRPRVGRKAGRDGRRARRPAVHAGVDAAADDRRRTVQQGQTLTASTGTFNPVATFTYAWQRCDAAGAACADIVGATAPTYLVATEDVATTLRVTVTATNRFGTATRQSVQTAVVT